MTKSKDNLNKAKKGLGAKLATAKLFELKEAKLFCIAISSEELFGKADTVLVSRNEKEWIAHSYDEFMDAINNGKPLRVAP